VSAGEVRNAAASDLRTERSESVGHVPVLDGLRAVAILGVMLMHFTIVEPRILQASNLPDRVLWQIGLAGWVGVDLFFVLSGFLITGILLDTKGGEGYFRNFYMRRVLRILPLYYGSLVVLFLVIPMVAPAIVHDIGRLSHGQVWLWTYLSNIAIGITGSWQAVPPLTGHYWSLAVEEQFYLLWPLVVYSVSRSRLLSVALGLWVGALALRIAMLWLGVSPTSVFVLTPTRMDGLAAGAAVATLARHPGGLLAVRQAIKRALSGGAVGLALIVLATGTLGQYDAIMQTAGFTLLSSTFAALLAFLLLAEERSLVHRFLAHPWARHIGMRSYALYVFHPWALKATARAWKAHLVPLVGDSGMAEQIMFWLVCLAASLAAAEVSWHLLEKRCLALKRFFPRSGREPAAAAIA